MEAYFFVAAAAVSAIIAIWKNYNKSTVLASVIKGVEDSAKYLPKRDLQKVKNVIAIKADKYGVGKALHKLVRLLTKEE